MCVCEYNLLLCEYKTKPYANFMCVNQALFMGRDKIGSTHIELLWWNGKKSVKKYSLMEETVIDQELDDGKFIYFFFVVPVI